MIYRGLLLSLSLATALLSVAEIGDLNVMASKVNAQSWADFYGKHNRVLIGLPPDWQINTETPPTVDAFYHPSEGDYDPQILVQVIALSEEMSTQAGCQQLADDLLHSQQFQAGDTPVTLISQENTQVSNKSARVDVIEFKDQGHDIEITQYQVCFQLSNQKIGVMLALVQSNQKDQYLPIFEAAAQQLVFMS